MDNSLLNIKLWLGLRHDLGLDPLGNTRKISTLTIALSEVFTVV